LCNHKNKEFLETNYPRASLGEFFSNEPINTKGFFFDFYLLSIFRVLNQQNHSMTFEELYNTLTKVDASRESRLECANIVLDDLSLFPKLLDIVFITNDKVSCRAAWVFEFVCANCLYAIIPHLDNFTSNINMLRYDSTIRPVAKVCEFIAKECTSKQYNTMNKMLLQKHREQIIEVCFDWLISDRKIAIKAYAMTTLFLLGKDYKWVYPELVQILQQDYQNQSPGFKARAKHILKKINTSTKI
tara:strand:+ start:5941 stop:6672 length:732 start_codon:yes stop_codon:yes gene_type:complete